MKLTLFTILALCIIAVCKSAEEEYDYEEEAAAPAPVTPAPTKPAGGRLGGLLSSRGRVNVPNVGKKKAPAQSTTSKPVEQAPEEEEVEGEDALDENQDEALTTTTESAKKLRNNGGVRPFRSNEDLLAALKRRRAQTGPSSHSRETAATHSAVEHTTAKSKASTNNRKASTSNAGNASNVGNDARTLGRGRFGGRGKTVQEEVEETQREEIQVKPTKGNSYRRRS
ncbi:uncharacterized protein LOC112454889 [Temnothorax curvispinosus]|uniref:Uncharacterized protein LOC112454889 n=1 Tax=Temnothorax curvispinosus TaxID=300111 RepID=A0A6J1PSM0_9HYME|nr:uncharacterized protein LOC112454889 [Temnothorax curvispinosus]